MPDEAKRKQKSAKRSFFIFLVLAHYVMYFIFILTRVPDLIYVLISLGLAFLLSLSRFCAPPGVRRVSRSVRIRRPVLMVYVAIQRRPQIALLHLPFVIILTSPREPYIIYSFTLGWIGLLCIHI